MRRYWLISVPRSQVKDRRRCSGELAHLADHGLGDAVGVVAAGEVQQDHEPGGAFDQGADRGAARGSDDQVAFPVPGHGPVGDLGGALADRERLAVGVRAPVTSTAPGSAGRAFQAQLFAQIGPQVPAGLHIERLVDRLGRHALHTPGRVLVGQHLRDQRR